MAPRTKLTKNHSTTLAKSIPFGPPPLIEGEDATAYDELLTRISATVKPADILEDIWVRDIVDLVWEILRLRRLKANVIMAKTNFGLFRALAYCGERRQLMADWARRQPSAIKRINRVLAPKNESMYTLMARALREDIDCIERIDRMTALAERRRDAILREIDRHCEKPSSRSMT